MLSCAGIGRHNISTAATGSCITAESYTATGGPRNTPESYAATGGPRNTPQSATHVSFVHRMLTQPHDARLTLNAATIHRL